MMEADVMIGSGLKVTCSRDEFVGRLGVVARAVSSRSSVQILAGVLLEAADGGLRSGRRFAKRTARRVAKPTRDSNHPSSSISH